MKHKTLLFTIVVLIVSLSPVWAQSANEQAAKEPAETSITFTCTSLDNDSIRLKAIVNVKREEGAMLLANAVVKFTVVAAGGDVSLKEAKTDFNGAAVLLVPSKNTFERDEQQMIHFKAEYAGDKKYLPSDAEFALKPAKLELSFYEEDSVKYVKVVASQLNADGQYSPLGPADINIAVTKMFSMLKVASISLDSTGIGNTEFPSDIIGDSLGNLNVIASIDENDVFGNVQGQKTIKWGIPKHLISPDRPSRELWTPIAPLWMIITLIIMLAGVWGHYIFAVVQLVMIKKSSNRKKKEEEEPA